MTSRGNRIAKDSEADSQQQESADPLKKFKRSYKACLTCRKRKAKCEVGVDDDPPCLRCRRERRECVFEAERAWGKKRKRHSEKTFTVYRDAAIEADRPYVRNANAANVIIRSDPVIPDSPSPDLDVSTSPKTPRPQRDQPADLTQSLMKTLLSNGSDALSLLSQAAMQQTVDDDVPQDAHSSGPHTSGNAATPASGSRQFSFGIDVIDSVLEKPIAPETCKLWKSSKFVKMGWISAEEAIRYIDHFYTMMAPLTPTVPETYADHKNHRHLLVEEPFLCCTILMISSRYHSLSGSGAASRGYFAHQKFCEFFQSLLMRLVLGQEKGSPAKLRTLGTIEALLLATEWHARNLYFPPDTNGWDCELIDDVGEAAEADQPRNEASQWLQTVRNSVERSDRMSWMLAGCAQSLAHELAIFDDDGEPEKLPEDSSKSLKRLRVRRLLFVFTNQLACRIGCMPMLPQGVDHKKFRLPDNDALVDRQQIFTDGWIELTKLLRSLCEICFPSVSVTQQLLQSGRYVSIIEHFSPLLAQWRSRYLDGKEFHDTGHSQLFIEYQFVRIFCNSIGMQAVCERAAGNSSLDASVGMSSLIDSEDRRYIEEVILGCFELLQKTNDTFSVDQSFFYAPVRIILRVTSSSMFLVKALAIGARQSHVRTAIEILERTVDSLRRKVLDDMHLADSFAALLELHISQLRKSAFGQQQRSLNPTSRSATRQPSMGPNNSASSQTLNARDETELAANEGCADLGDWDEFSFMFNDFYMDGWPSLPSNPTLTSLLHSGGMFAPDYEMRAM